MFQSGTTALIISNVEKNDISKIVKSLKISGLLIKVVVNQFKLKRKNKKVDLLVCH